MGDNEIELDLYTWTDFQEITFPPQFAADCLQVSTQTLKMLEKDAGLNIARVARGSVQIRSYTLDDLFTLAAYRRDRGHVKGFGRPITLSTFVQKGGTSKTTTTCNLAILFALRGFKTLVIDNDPQGDASSMFGYDPDLTPEELQEVGAPTDLAVNGHIGNLLQIGYQPMSLNEVVKMPFGEHGPHLIPAESLMDDLDSFLRTANGSDFRYSLFIEQARSGLLAHCDLSDYDIIIMDNAPSNTMLTRNAIVAADFLISPVRMDKFSYRSLARLAERLTAFARDFQRSAEIIVIPSMYVKNRPRQQRNMAKLATLFPGKVVETPLYQSEDYDKSLEDGVPIALWKPGSENSLGAMRDVFKEVIARIQKKVEARK
ncbi:ParA family protein [Crenobacter sp. SG2305]|uniref:ParA family protein n=1 Tax=Crenobacter oryzisoli TaxID=3056844 RepID=UPI0025AB5660|nr:ParA family protein [Crenobacter sp. SG2305]MDN0082464.1 ParA family protein [Crenobacter sp. SG2305]